MNRTPIVGLKKFRFDDRRCGSFVCVYRIPRLSGNRVCAGAIASIPKKPVIPPC